MRTRTTCPATTMGWLRRRPYTYAPSRWGCAGWPGCGRGRAVPTAAAVGAGGPLPAQTGGPLVSEVAHDLEGTSQGFNLCEAQADGNPHAFVGVQHQGADEVIDIARRRVALALAGFVEFGALQPQA